MLKGSGSSHHKKINSRNRSISESQSASHSYAGTSKNDDSGRVRRMSGGNGIRKRYARRSAIVSGVETVFVLGVNRSVLQEASRFRVHCRLIISIVPRTPAEPVHNPSAPAESSTIINEKITNLGDRLKRTSRIKTNSKRFGEVCLLNFELSY